VSLLAIKKLILVSSGCNYVQLLGWVTVHLPLDALLYLQANSTCHRRRHGITNLKHQSKDWLIEGETWESRVYVPHNTQQVVFNSHFRDECLQAITALVLTAKVKTNKNALLSPTSQYVTYTLNATSSTFGRPIFPELLNDYFMFPKKGTLGTWVVIAAYHLDRQWRF